MQRKIRNHSWVQGLQLMICGDEPGLKAGKPAPDPFLMGAEGLNASPEDCWAFEDSKAGCESALRAGCLVWRLLRPNEVADRLDPGEQSLMQSNRLLAIQQLSEAESCLTTLVSKAD